VVTVREPHAFNFQRRLLKRGGEDRTGAGTWIYRSTVDVFWRKFTPGNIHDKGTDVTQPAGVTSTNLIGGEYGRQVWYNQSSIRKHPGLYGVAGFRVTFDSETQRFSCNQWTVLFKSNEDFSWL
jgi:hypothetical protein